MPTVGKHERTLVREMPFAGFYRVVTRYGYMDEVRPCVLVTPPSRWSPCPRMQTPGLAMQRSLSAYCSRRRGTAIS